MARITQTTVTASESKQKYEYSNGFLGLFKKDIDLGPWEGTVFSFGPHGGRQVLQRG